VGFASKGDLVGFLHFQRVFLAMNLAQMGKQIHFLFIGDFGISVRDLDTRLVELYHQSVNRDADGLSELPYRNVCHLSTPQKSLSPAFRLQTRGPVPS